MFCPQCGYKNEDTSRFCQGCGNRLENGGKSVAQSKASTPAPPPRPAGQPAQKNVAPPPPPPPPSVGAAPKSAGAGFQSIPTPQPAAPGSQPKNTQFTGSPGQSCPVCGQPVAAGKSFCTSCGNKIGGVNSQPMQSAPTPNGAPGQTASLTGVGVGLRAVAAILDSLVFMLIGWIMAGTFGTTSSSGFELSGAPFFVLMLLGFLYYVVFEGTLGATPGKLVIGLRVVKTDGSKCGISSSIIRNVLRIVDALPALYLLGIILIVSSKSKQRLGDRLAGTMVVKRGGGSGQASRRSGGATQHHDYDDSSYND